MIFHHPSDSRAFFGVALALILTGAAVVAVSLVQWIVMIAGNGNYGWPAAKLAAGLIITALGYVVLELELIRTKK